MSNDLEPRVMPPDFGDDDDDDDDATKDDDQMFKSATLPVTDEIRLSDDEEDNPFGEPIASKTLATSIFEPATHHSSPLAATDSQPLATHLDSGVTSTDTKHAEAQSLHSTASFSSQLSPPAVVPQPIASDTNETVATSKPSPRRSDDHNIEITVSDPTKVGEVGILLRSAMVYTSMSLVLSRASPPT